MNLESFENVNIEIESGYERFIPQDFKDDPFGYFEREGKNIKSGEVTHAPDGRVKEDPTAVKDLPSWSDGERELGVVGKKVNTAKAEVAKSGNPLYEYNMMRVIRELGLPCPAPIASIQKGENFLFIMEKAPGFRVVGSDIQKLRELGYSETDLEHLKQEAEGKLDALETHFVELGVERHWDLKDMIFDIEHETKSIRGVTPVDWERAKFTKEHF